MAQQDNRSQDTPFGTPSSEASGTPRSPFGDPNGDGSPELAMARQWVQENQPVAMAAAFVFGLFVGYKMRH